MKKLKKLLPPEERILDVGWNDDGQLLLCIKYFDGDENYNGALPFSFFSSSIQTLDDLEREVRIHFGIEYPSPDDGENLAGVDVLKRILIDKFDDASTPP